MKNYQRIVIKIGTSTICRPNGTVNLRKIEKLARVLTDLKNSGHDVVLVSSGAIAVGTNKLGLSKRPASISGKQAAAAVGQCELMHIYDRYFMEYGSTTAQLLLTKETMESDKTKQNIIATFQELFQTHAIPIINENDSIATEEIVYGDNDTLSAVVSVLVDADLLIILSDIDGLYDCDPTNNPDARRIPVVHSLQHVQDAAKGSHTENGTGGMITKLHAVQIASEKQIPTIIASGESPEILYDIMDGRNPGTLFEIGEEK